MNRRHFLKRAAQAAAAVSAAAVVGREVGGDWESDDYSHFVTDADGITGRSETHVVVDEVQDWSGDWADIRINEEKFKLAGDGAYSRNAIPLVKPSLTVDLAQYLPDDGAWHTLKFQSTARLSGSTLLVDGMSVVLENL